VGFGEKLSVGTKLGRCMAGWTVYVRGSGRFVGVLRKRLNWKVWKGNNELKLLIPLDSDELMMVPGMQEKERGER
jgi:hypothetical protein